MITFFRRIRKTLLGSGATRKPVSKYERPVLSKVERYLLYAAGEVLLVLVGILLALQINNWNELQKNNSLEKEYYCRLLEDVEHDKVQLENILSDSNYRLKFSNQAARLLQQNVAIKNEVGIAMIGGLKGVLSHFVPSSSAFEDLKSGANLNIIKDKEIIKALNGYNQRVEGLNNIAKTHANIISN